MAESSLIYIRPARSKPRAEPCNPSEGLGYLSPKVGGNAWGWFHRAATTSRSWQWKDNKPLSSRLIWSNGLIKLDHHFFCSLHLNQFCTVWIVILLISAWVLNSRCSSRVLFSLQCVISIPLWVQLLPLCCFFLLACADEVSRGGGTHTSWVSFGWLLSGGSGFSLDGLDRTVDLILHWWVGLPSFYIKCTPHLPWPLPSRLNWKSGFFVPGISHSALSWPAGLIEWCPTSLLLLLIRLGCCQVSFFLLLIGNFVSERLCFLFVSASWNLVGMALWGSI